MPSRTPPGQNALHCRPHVSSYGATKPSGGSTDPRCLPEPTASQMPPDTIVATTKPFGVQGDFLKKSTGVTPPPNAGSRLLIREDHGVLVVKILEQRLTDPSMLESISQSVRRNLHRAEATVLIDCSAVSYNCSSHFLGVLVALRKEAMRRKLWLCLCGVHGPLREALQIAKFDMLFPLYASQPEAIRAQGGFTERERTWHAVKQAENKSLIDQLKAAEKDANRQARANWIADTVAWAVERVSPSGVPRISPTVAARGAMMLALTAVSAIVLAVLWAFSDGGGDGRARAAAAIPYLSTYPATQLSGAVVYWDRDKTVGDASARLYAWPAALRSDTRFSATNAQQPLNPNDPLPQDGLYRGRTGPDGRFSIKAHALGNFSLLIVSGNLKRPGPLLGRDLAALTDRFDDPVRLIGDQQYILTTCRIDAAAPQEVEFVVGGAAAQGRP